MNQQQKAFRKMADSINKITKAKAVREQRRALTAFLAHAATCPSCAARHSAMLEIKNAPANAKKAQQMAESALSTIMSRTLH